MQWPGLIPIAARDLIAWAVGSQVVSGPRAFHVSRLTSHVSRLTPHLSRLTLSLVFAAPLSAQAIAPGRWPATLHFADRDSAVATFDVTMERNRVLIEVTTPAGNNWGMGNVRADSTRLRFTWAIDRPEAMQCELSRRSAVYWEGHCEDRVRGNDGTFARMLVTLKREM